MTQGLLFSVNKKMNIGKTENAVDFNCVGGEKCGWLLK